MRATLASCSARLASNEHQELASNDGRLRLIIVSFAGLLNVSEGVSRIIRDKLLKSGPAPKSHNQ